jgi:hypothetical protein
MVVLSLGSLFTLYDAARKTSSRQRRPFILSLGTLSRKSRNPEHAILDMMLLSFVNDVRVGGKSAAQVGTTEATTLNNAMPFYTWHTFSLFCTLAALSMEFT